MLRAFFGVILAVGFLVILVLFGIGFIAGSGRRGTTAHIDEAGRGDLEAQPSITVSAPKLWVDYQSNEVQADNIYKGRRLIVRGFVTAIRKDFADNIIVALGTGNEFETVDARVLNTYAGTAASLHKWEVVDVVCQGAGMVVGSPQLTDCSVQLARNDPAPVSPTIVQPQVESPTPTQSPSDPSPTAPANDGSQQPAPIERQTPSDGTPQN